MSDPAIANNQREFRCNHCSGKILIPRNLPATTGPCPHCGGVITSPAPEAETPVAPMQVTVPVHVQAPPATPVQAPAVAQLPTVAQAPPPAQTPAVTQAPAAVPQKAVIPPPRQSTAPTAAQGPSPTPLTEIQTAEAPAKLIKPKAKSRKGLIAAMLVFLALILAAGAALFFVMQEMGRNIEPPAATVAVDPQVTESQYLRIGWQKEAYDLLRDFMEADSAQGKLPYVIPTDGLEERIDLFYGGVEINDADTPAEAFSVYELSMEDRKRGMFMMIYDQPPQFNMREFFRPLASLEVQYGLEEADVLLDTMARVGNFAMEPVRAHAFFKRTKDGLKLDWEIFAQTKYRTLRSFVELPELDQKGVFRVFIVEDVPDKGRAVAGTRTYRVADPANTTDSARVNVKVDSEIGRALSIINWRGTKETKPITRTATVELRWGGDEAPELEITRFICWEFLGLGGQAAPATASSN
jgi:hypothetical protein